MCLAVPMRLVERDRLDGIAELHGVRRRVGLMLCPEATVGDFVLVHAGDVIGLIDEVEARRTLDLLSDAVGEELS